MKKILFVALALAGGSGQATAKVITVAVPDGGQPVVAKADASGTIHVAYETSGGPQYARLPAGSKTLSLPVPLVDRASRKPGLEFTIWDMAIGSDGAVHVVMGTNAWKLKLPKEEWGFMYTQMAPGYTAFEPARNINHKPSEGFSLAVGEGGRVAAVWMADKLYANLSTDSGATFGPTVEIDPSLNPCNCCTTSAVYGADGRLAILYREEANNERDMYLALWDQEQNKVTKTRISTTGWKIDSCPMTYYSVARSQNGYVAAWPTRGEIYFARMNSDGSLQMPREIKTPGSSGMRTGVLALPMGDGGALVAWKKDNQLGWQAYDDRGRPVGSPGSMKSVGSGAAGAVDKRGDVILFR